MEEEETKVQEKWKMCVIKQRYGFKTLEKEMAPYSSILAWKIPWTEEPGGLQSMGSQRVGHDWVHKVLERTVKLN